VYKNGRQAQTITFIFDRISNSCSLMTYIWDVVDVNDKDVNPDPHEIQRIYRLQIAPIVSRLLQFTVIRITLERHLCYITY